MFYNLKTKLKRSWYNLNCRAIFETKPLRIREAPLLFLTMVSHDDLLMYLVAIKSLYWRIGEGSIVVINDGSLKPDDIDRLNHHLGRPEILDVRRIETGPCPRGGTWERLLTAMDLCADHYVIQVDSDTLTLNAVPEVAEDGASEKVVTSLWRVGRGLGIQTAAAGQIEPDFPLSGHTSPSVISEAAYKTRPPCFGERLQAWQRPVPSSRQRSVQVTGPASLC